MLMTKNLPVESSSEDGSEMLFDYVRRRSLAEEQFGESIISMYERNARLSNLLMRVVVSFIGCILRPRKRQVRFYFWGHKFDELILSLPMEEVCVVGGPRQLLFCLKHRRAFLPEMRFWRLLADGLKFESISKREKLLSLQIKRLSQRLRFFGLDNAVCIVENDSLPAQRVFIQASRLAGLSKVVCIQHGIFQRRSPAYILDGWLSDLFFVIDENQKNLLVDKGMSSEKIRVMGFYNSPYTPKRSLSPLRSRRVCFIGQPWGKYGGEREERYLAVLTRLLDFFQSKGFEFYFKPHPWERELAYIASLPNVTDISMTDALERYDVFVSLTSTALLEAVASGRIGVQIVDSLFDADRFSELYKIASVDFDDPLFESALESAVFGDEGCRGLPTPLAQRFLGALASGYK